MTTYEVKTVRVKSGGGFMRINEADLNEDEHELWQEDGEVDALRAKAKELGIKGYHNMKMETLQAAIAEQAE